MGTWSCDGCERRNPKRVRAVTVLGHPMQLCAKCRQISLEEWGARLAKKLGLKPIPNSKMSRWLTSAEIRRRAGGT